LQGHFNEFNFSLEVKEYEREQIQWSYDDFYFQTNTKCIELIEGKRTGVLSLLDEQCIMPNGCDETFCLKLSQIVDHPHLQLARMSVTQFTIKHYAADVVYDVQGFCAKNKDPVQPALMDLLSKGSSQYVQMLFGEYDGPKNSIDPSKPRVASQARANSTIIFESVTAKFKRQLTDLMQRIYAAQPHFVRCINPNSRKVARQLEPEMVLDQLRCSGLMEAVRVSRAGFPVRILHTDFVSRFNILVEPANPSDSAQNQVQSMVLSLNVLPDSYRIGITKLFLRREVHEKLEEDRSRLLVRQALEIQRICRGHIARNHVRFLRMLRRESAVQLQRHIRKTLAFLWYQRNLQAWKAHNASSVKPVAQQHEQAGPVAPAENGMRFMCVVNKSARCGFLTLFPFFFRIRCCS
jgi:myosin heavy subunit